MYKIGSAMDIHRLKKGTCLVLGGITIPCEYSFIAHSDGDVLLHAIVEALIGALGQGDLGDHFPDTNPKYQGIDSSFFVAEVNKMLQVAKYHIVNLDCSIYLEKPKLKEYKQLMANNVAKLLKIEANCVNIKAGTMEGLGMVGQNAAVIAHCSVLIEN